METEKLTLKILETLDPKTILYAELAEGGAMGAAGTARIYTMEDKTPHFYLADITTGEEEQVKVYSAVYTLLGEQSKKGKALLDADGGFGNHAYKAKNAEFTRDDDECAFIYTQSDAEYSLSASCPGVYFKVVSEFAVRPIDQHFLKKYLRKLRKYEHLTPEEDAFYCVYIEQITRNDKNHPDFNITLETYWNAIMYLRYLSHERFNLSPDEMSDGIHAIQKYRLKLIVEKIGWRNLDAFFANFVADKQTMLFLELDKVITEITMSPFQAEALAEAHSDNPSESVLKAHNIKPNKKQRRNFRYRRAKIISNHDDSMAIKSHSAFKISNTFTELNYISSSHTSLDPFDDDNIANLFKYPVIVKFTDAAHHKIIRTISEMKDGELRADAKSIQYYFANYVFNEDTLSYADVFPAVVHVIDYLPEDDLKHTDTPNLFWVASEIIDRIWRYADETDSTQQKVRDLIFRLYMPHVGGVWPVDHYNEFTFNEPAATAIFNESLGFLYALDDLTSRVPDFKAYFSAYTPGILYPTPITTGRAFYEYYHSLPAKEQFDTILTNCNPEDYSERLKYPNTTEEADLVLDELFRTDSTARITGYARLGTLEQLLITPNRLGIGEHILKYICDHFDTLVTITDTEAKALHLNFFEIISSFFTAAATGVTEENEFPPLTTFGKKLSRLAVERATEQVVDDIPEPGTVLHYNPVETIIDDALKYARKHRRTILFQRSALQQLF